MKRDLAVNRANHFAGEGEEDRTLGVLLAGTGHSGVAARPLDGGALTRWGARTPTRGPATAPGLAAPLLRLARSRFAARCSLR